LSEIQLGEKLVAAQSIVGVSPMKLGLALFLAAVVFGCYDRQSRTLADDKQ
jgi:hypothetical protein